MNDQTDPNDPHEQLRANLADRLSRLDSLSLDDLYCQLEYHRGFYDSADLCLREYDPEVLKQTSRITYESILKRIEELEADLPMPPSAP